MLNESKSDSRFWWIYLAGLIIAALGCVPVENNGFNDGVGGGNTNISGTVGGESFTVQSGSAELNVDGKYVITLADTPEFSCDSSSGLPMNFLQVVIGEIEADAPQTYDADGRVFFNVFEDGVSVGDGADTGSVSVETVDEFGGFIDGSIDATGPDSSVSGDFSVEICN